jgi:hypothetical protein
MLSAKGLYGLLGVVLGDVKLCDLVAGSVSIVRLGER